jgi:hypothetical protein
MKMILELLIAAAAICIIWDFFTPAEEEPKE